VDWGEVAVATKKQQLDGLKLICPIAVEQEHLTGLPAEMMVAQWAVESDWGISPVGFANYFGIKFVRGWHKYSTLRPTTEYFTAAQYFAWRAKFPGRQSEVLERVGVDRLKVRIQEEFAEYTSLFDSAQDYATLITKGFSTGWPYMKPWLAFVARQRADVDTLIMEVCKIYATSAYGKLAVEISKQANVRGWCKEARKARKETLV
jgi:flagellum-specific peptidoglycan hydrolase FlgJ